MKTALTAQEWERVLDFCRRRYRSELQALCGDKLPQVLNAISMNRLYGIKQGVDPLDNLDLAKGCQELSADCVEEALERCKT